jgi:thiamine pyrophosphate-dependent acetolactate synthase large subunit-like protein
MRTEDCLRELVRHRSDEVVIAAMTSAMLWPTLSRHPRDLIYVPSTMGGAPGLGLGIAMARPDLRVVVLNGDGSMLMNLGSLVTIGEQAPRNLVLIVFDNGLYAVTGGQVTPGAGRVDFAAIARAAGWPSAHCFSQLREWAGAAPGLLAAGGPVFVQLKVHPEPGSISTPAVPMTERLARFRAAVGA